MKVYCVCIEEIDDEGDTFRVEVFSTIENATLYLNDITVNGTSEDITGDIVEYTIDSPESGNTAYTVEDSDYTTSDDGECSSSD